MKATDVILLQESVDSMLSVIDTAADDHGRREVNAKHLATLMVLRDMDLRYKNEDHPLKSNTFLDYLYGDGKTTKRAVDLFYKRIQENPRARNLMKKYVEQFLDYDYGAKAMRHRIRSLRDHFSKRKDQRVKHHEDTIVNNFNAAQDKLRADYQQDMKDA